MARNEQLAAEVLHRHHENCNDAAQALNIAGLIAPDLPEPDIRTNDQEVWNPGEYETRAYPHPCGGEGLVDTPLGSQVPPAYVEQEALRMLAAVRTARTDMRRHRQ